MQSIHSITNQVNNKSVTMKDMEVHKTILITHKQINYLLTANSIVHINHYC